MVKCSNKRICCVRNNPKAVNPFLTIETKTWIRQCFFVDCPKIPIWSVLSLNCCRLFKIYTSYIISKCTSVKMINIPWLWVLHFYLLSVQSYKRRKLTAFKESLFHKTNRRDQWTRNLCRENQYFRQRPYIHTSWTERCTCLLVKKTAFMSKTEMIIAFCIFLRLRDEKRCILWK